MAEVLVKVSFRHYCSACSELLSKREESVSEEKFAELGKNKDNDCWLCADDSTTGICVTEGLCTKCQECEMPL